MHCQSKPSTTKSTRGSTSTAVESQKKGGAVKVSSPSNIEEKRPSFEADLRWQKKSLNDEFHTHDGLEQDAQQKKNSSVSLYNSILPQQVLKSDSGDHEQNHSPLVSLSSKGQRQNQLFQYSTSSCSHHGVIASGISLSEISNGVEPSSLTMTSPRAAECLSRTHEHHLRDLDWPKTCNCMMQGGRETVNQYHPSQLLQPTPKDFAMAMATRTRATPADASRSALGLETSSSRSHHRLIIENALSTLRAFDDRAYLAKSTQREQVRTQRRIALEEYISQSNVQSRVHEDEAEAERKRPKNVLVERLSGDGIRDQRYVMDKSRVEQLQEQMKDLSSNPII
jgi:hypothetical protein